MLLGVLQKKIFYFDIDADGILKVFAKELISGQKNNITIRINKGRLTSDEIKKMLKDTERYKVEDLEYKVDAYNELEDYVYGIKTKMKGDLKKMDDVVKEATQWLDENKHAEINVIAKKKKKLERVCNSGAGPSY